MEKNITSSTLVPESELNPMEPAVQSSAARGKITVMKTSYFKPPVTGAGYGVYTDKACTKAVDALWIGTVEKNSDEASNLPFGTYYVKEFSAPKGYKLDEVVYEVTLTQSNPSATVNSLEPTTEEHGNIKVVKNSYFNEPVTGTGFGIYRDKACTDAVDALWIGLWESNSDLSVDLPLGTYYVKEFSTLSGNYADKNVYEITLAKNGDVPTVTSIAPTTKAHGNIKVVKESKFSLPVTGAGYGVYKDKACTQSMDSLWIGLADANSDISCDLPAGTYYVKEFAAPDKYALDKTVHTVNVKNGQTATVTSDEPLNTVLLYRPNGEFYSYAKVGQNFPSVACVEYNVLGWCNKKNPGIFTSGKDIVDTVDEYYMEGDRINSAGAYYMVAYKERTDSYQVNVSVPKDDTVVYFVGDSRVFHLFDALNSESTDKNSPRKLNGKIEMIAQMGEGINWFKKDGLSLLEKKLSDNTNKNKGKKNIIIFNLGVNDAGSEENRAKYKSIFAETITKLRAIDSGCKLYYANVYPVSDATLYEHDRQANVSVTQIKTMNDKIIDIICGNGTYTKIDLYNHLKRYGWFYAKNEATEGPNKDNPNKGKLMYDGIHPSPTTAASIYQFCIDETGCGDGTTTLQLHSN